MVLLWVMKEREHLVLVAFALKAILARDKNAVTAQIQLYVTVSSTAKLALPGKDANHATEMTESTAKISGSASEHEGSVLDVTYGRPSMSKVVTEIGKGRTMVFGCGPSYEWRGGRDCNASGSIGMVISR